MYSCFSNIIILNPVRMHYIVIFYYEELQSEKEEPKESDRSQFCYWDLVDLKSKPSPSSSGGTSHVLAQDGPCCVPAG